MKSTKRLGKLHPGSRRAMLLALGLSSAVAARAADDLTLFSLEQLLEVTVIGASKYEQKQSEVAAAVSVITRSEIKAQGWRTLAAALASLPGVHTTYDRQYSYVGARGFGLPGDFNTRLLVTINGNRANDVTYDSGPMGSIFPLDMDLVERIEFIPGPGGAVYGQNAMLGVVNVVTRKGSDLDGTELAVAGQQPQGLREGRASWGRRLDNGVDMLLSVRGMHAGGEDRVIDFGEAGVTGLAAGLDGERDREFFARIAHGGWALDLVYGNRRKDDPTGAYFSDPLTAGQYQSDRYMLAQLQYDEGFLDNTLQMMGRLFAGQQNYDSILSYEGAQYGYPAVSHWRGGELRLLSTALANHKLMFGLEFQDNVRIKQSILDLATPDNNIVIRGSGYRAGLYAQDEWRIVPTLSATLGLRVDRNDATGTHTSPRAGLIWQAAANTNLKALYGRAHRAPNAYERDYDDAFAQVANPALQGERIDTLEFVADQRVGRDLQLRASIYQWTLHQIVTLDTLAGTDLLQYQSGQDVKAQGLELSADKTWQGGARLRGSASLQRLRQDDGSSLVNAPQRLAKLNFSTPLPWANLRLGYEWQYDSARRTNDGSDLGGFGLSNLHLSAEGWAPGLEVSLSVKNLADKRYFTPASDSNWQNAFEQDGRSVSVKAAYRF